MQSNNLHAFTADESRLAIYAGDGFTVATITDGKVKFHGTDTLRPVELRHLADIAENFAAFHAVAFAGNDYSQRLMPIIPTI